MKTSNKGRRDLLVKMAAAGVLGPAGFYALVRNAVAFDGKDGITQIKGKVTVDGKPAVRGQVIKPGQRIQTGPASEVIFIYGKDVFLLREDTEFAVEQSLGVTVLRFVTGKVLSVFGRGPKQLRTSTATIGIRGTGCYIESEPARTYFCLCYGEAELVPHADPAAKQVIRTKHHEYPLYIGKDSGEPMVAKGPVINHTDAELTMLEALVGRKPPFYGETYSFHY